MAAFNLSIAFGAVLGGFTADGVAVAGVLWVTSGLALAAALIVGVNRTRHIQKGTRS
ncbi:hypothetical protein ACFSTC_04320 [Nonomuraea ferruginea]